MAEKGNIILKTEEELIRESETASIDTSHIEIDSSAPRPATEKDESKTEASREEGEKGLRK